MMYSRLILSAFVLLLVLCLAPARLPAQPGYEWTVYSSMNSGQSVDFNSDGRLWVATTGGVFGYDITTDTYQIFHTRDQVYPEKQGLLSLNSTAVALDPATGDMYVGSDDGLVSIRKKSGAWSYSAEIATMSDRPSRMINGFGFFGGNVYFLTAFGVGVYNPTDSSFIESYFRFGAIPSNTPVRSIDFWKGRIWVGTDKGLASAPAGALNLTAPDSWTVPPMLEGRSILSFAQFGESMLVGTDSGAYMIDTDGNGSRRDDLPIKPVLVASNNGQVVAADEVSLYTYNGSAFISATGVPGIIKDIVLTPGGIAGIALRDSGFAYWKDGQLSTRHPNTPASNAFVDLALNTDGSVWCANDLKGFSRLKEEEWKVFNKASLQSLSVEQVWYVGAGREGEMWASSYGGGVVRMKETTDGVEAERFDQTNSPLVSSVAGTDSYVVVGKSLTDRNGRTWIVNFNTQAFGPSLVVRLRPDEESRDGSGFEEFISPFPSMSRGGRALAIDENGTKWVGFDERASPAYGLLYLNDRGTPGTQGDDSWGLLTTGDNLLDNRQAALVVDRLGELWVGTPRGAQVLVNPSSVVNNDSRPVFRSIRALTDISIKAIEVDALNRKWVGTDQGVFLLSAEGDQVLARYTTANSPLVNNQIRSILAVHSTGDIYIGTTNGLNRIRTEAVEPRDGSGTLVVSPHPFILPASEPLRITGLPADATVKIFAQGMTLVREFLAPGGAVALWDGRDDAGNPVPSGVYIIAAGAGSGDVAVVGKVAVIRR